MLTPLTPDHNSTTNNVTAHSMQLYVIQFFIILLLISVKKTKRESILVFLSSISPAPLSIK